MLGPRRNPGPTGREPAAPQPYRARSGRGGFCPSPTSAAPLPQWSRPPEAPRGRGRHPAAAPEEDEVGGVEREEAVQRDEKRAEPLPRQPHPTQSSGQAAAATEPRE